MDVENLATLIYQHARVGKISIGCVNCPDLEFMTGWDHALHVAEVIASVHPTEAKES